MRALVWTAAEKRRDEEDTLEETKEQNSGCGAGGRSGNSLLDPLSAVAVLNDLEISRQTAVPCNTSRRRERKSAQESGKNALALPSLPYHHFPRGDNLPSLSIADISG